MIAILSKVTLFILLLLLLLFHRLTFHYICQLIFNLYPYAEEKK